MSEPVSNPATRFTGNLTKTVDTMKMKIAFIGTARQEPMQMGIHCTENRTASATAGKISGEK
jgi:hypothetical protein